jgi:hypothetical protein
MTGLAYALIPAAAAMVVLIAVLAHRARILRKMRHEHPPGSLLRAEVEDMARHNVTISDRQVRAVLSACGWWVLGCAVGAAAQLVWQVWS